MTAIVNKVEQHISLGVKNIVICKQNESCMERLQPSLLFSFILPALFSVDLCL